MIHKRLRLFFAMAACGLLFVSHAATLSASEHYIPPPLTPQLSSDGKSLYYAASPAVYIADPNPPAERLRVPMRYDLLSMPESATATFSITYVANGDTDPWGAACIAFPEEAKTAFNAAAAVWGNILKSPVPITIRACWSNLDEPDTLGYSGGAPLHKDFTGATRANTWYKGALANALAGYDLDPTEFDMHLTYNSNFSWYYGTNGNTPSTQMDLMTVILHEIAHGLNISGSMSRAGGLGSWGHGDLPAHPDIYDTFMRDGSGNSLIDTAVYANPSAALGSALTSDNVWFHGSNAMTANGGRRVKIYAPSLWAAGSSYSHLDYNTFHGTENQLMVYALPRGAAIHDPGPVAEGILKDVGWSGSFAALYFPHISTADSWQTEIAVINMSDQPVAGILRALSNSGLLVEAKAVTLSARGRKQISVADEFTNHSTIGYMIFDTDTHAVAGYTKFYIDGAYRAAIPAAKEVNTSNIHIPHIASNADWSTGISLVNTTSSSKGLTFTFSNGQSKSLKLDANQHRVFDIASLFNNQPQPGIQWAIISNAGGVIGLELFGSRGWGTQLEGILITDKTSTTLYYPHVASDEWWTGIVAYNPSVLPDTITIAPYSVQGTALSSSSLPIAGMGKYVGAVADLDLPAQTAWFRIDSTRRLSGFELFGTTNGQQLAAYAGGGAVPAKTGVFPKIEKSGWTGIAFVNTETVAASVTLKAYNDSGAVVAARTLTVGSHAKVVDAAENIFSQDISDATYIGYTADQNVAGFQLNGSLDGTMLDGLPALTVD